MPGTVLVMGGLLAPELETLGTRFTVLRLNGEEDPDTVLRRHAREIVGIVASVNHPVSRALIEALPNLEIVCRFGIGVDNIDLVAAAERGIAVTNTPDLVTADTADTSMALILALLRRVVEADLFVRVGKWKAGTLPLGVCLSGKRLGIVGLGQIGQALARRAEAFDMVISYYGPREKPDQPYGYYGDLIEMARESDILALCCPGGEETRNLVGAEVLEALGSHGFLVNVARGSVVDEAALVAALQSRTIAGAGLDVFASEPHVPEDLFRLDNVVLLPHIGTATLETRTKMGHLVLENLFSYFDGRPLATPLDTGVAA